MAGSLAARRHYGRHRPKARLINWTHGLINRCVMVADGTVLLAAGGIAWLFLAASPRPLTWLQSLTVALFMTISFVGVMRWLNLYRVERYSRILRSLLEVACGFVPAAIAGGVILAAFAPRIWSQCDWIVSWFLFIFVGLLLERQVARLLLTIV